MGEKSLLVNQTRSVLGGQFIGILGNNGSGKSTFLKTLAGIIPPHKGQIFLKHRPIDFYSTQELAQIRGYIPAEPLCFWSLQVKDILNILKDHPVVENLDLAPLWNQSFHHLSSGEKARLMLAFQLSKNLNILFVDEILSHLDDGYQIQVMDLLKEFTTKERRTVVLTLHQEVLAHIYCHQVWHIQEECFVVKKRTPFIPHEIKTL
ncbi:MAG: ATP-binding cassette domain-containing protein [Alphaproteobacteria bacterium]